MDSLVALAMPMMSSPVSLEPNSEVLFVKELCDLLVYLEVASYGSGKAISCLLMEKDTMININKVEKALRSTGKKSGAIQKVYAAA